jgi:hypothetical protein
MNRSWCVVLVTLERAKTGTALEAALLSAVERALYDPRHTLHRKTFGYLPP